MPGTTTAYNTTTSNNAASDGNSGSGNSASITQNRVEVPSSAANSPSNLSFRAPSGGFLTQADLSNESFPLTNASMALAEFAQVLRRDDESSSGLPPLHQQQNHEGGKGGRGGGVDGGKPTHGLLVDHIVHLLPNIANPATLVRVARALEEDVDTGETELGMSGLGASGSLAGAAETLTTTTTGRPSDNEKASRSFLYTLFNTSRTAYSSSGVQTSSDAKGGPLGALSSTINSTKSFNSHTEIVDSEDAHASTTTTDIPICDPLLQPGVPVLPTVITSEGRRLAVSSEPLQLSEIESFVPHVETKTSQEARQIRRYVLNCHLFSGLDKETVNDIVNAMQREVQPAGTAILEEGMEPKERLYIIAEGTCEVIKAGKAVGSLHVGNTFGELEIMYKQNSCAATVRTVTTCLLYTLDAATYHYSVAGSNLQQRQRYEKLTLNVPILRFMPDFERMKIAEALETRTYTHRQYVIEFGTRGTHMHFIREGEAKVVGRHEGHKMEVVRLGEGDVIGELEFLFGHLAVADVVVTSPRLVTACISRQHFELIAGPIQDRLKEFVATNPSYEKYYIAQAASESVSRELSRISSFARSRNRVMPQSGDDDFTMTFGNADKQGEILLPISAKLISQTSGGNAGGGGSGLPREPSNLHEHDSCSSLSEESGAVQQRPNWKKVLTRFPILPIVGNKVVMIGLREDGLIFSWNKAAQRVTGYTAEEVIGQNVYSLLMVEREQRALYKAVTEARKYAGDAEVFFQANPLPSLTNTFTLARSDGLTKATVQLSVVPSLMSAGGARAEVVLAVGEEITRNPIVMMEQPQWLSGQLQTILANADMSESERLNAVTEALRNYDEVNRATNVSTEHLRVVNVRQLVGQVVMEFGGDCVTKGLAVRQRFEGLVNERAYLDAALLPECLQYAMRLCVQFCDEGTITLTAAVTETNNLEFLVFNFTVAGQPGLPGELSGIVSKPIEQVEEDYAREEDDTRREGSLGSRSEAFGRVQRQQLRRVKVAVQGQGGTMRIYSSDETTNVAFVVPYMPATEDEPVNSTVEDSLNKEATLPSGSRVAFELSAGLLHEGTLGDAEEFASPTAASPTAATAGITNFTTMLAEDTPAHRNMICSFLWERKHAVLPAYKLSDIDQLTGVADILFIDLNQSIISSLAGNDPISFLQEKARHMAIVITADKFEEVSAETYHDAGFITLRKPCTPVQAIQAIRKAEQKIAVVKQEAQRITQTREALSKNSRGAWRRGKLLGKGSFGEVYQAVDELTGGIMAVKEMRLGKNTGQIEQFVDEISTMCDLQHPNIIHYFHCEQDEAANVIRVFMEYAPGGTLQDKLRKEGKLSFPVFQALLRDITEGIAYIHSQQYVHSDIKTANVLLGADNKGKIGDFGTARTVVPGQLLYDMKGSPLYMSPECMSAGDIGDDGEKIGYSFPSDIWSLGCVVLEMATNKPPFAHIKGINGPAGFTHYVTSLNDTPDLSPLFDLPPAIIEFVSACLHPEPSKRATAVELLQFSVFSEGSDDSAGSALKALKRAQLLHVLNKYVAFQDPEEVPKTEVTLVRRKPGDFFDSSDSSSTYSSESSGTDNADAGAARVKPGKSESASPDPVGLPAPFDDDDASPSPKKRSKTRARAERAGTEDREAVFFNSSSSSNGDGHGSSSSSTSSQSGSAAQKSKPRLSNANQLSCKESSMGVGAASGGGGGATSDLLLNIKRANLWHGKSASSNSNLPPPNLTNASFLAFSFNKNVSFMGAHMDDALNGAANAFVNALVPTPMSTPDQSELKAAGSEPAVTSASQPEASSEPSQKAKPHRVICNKSFFTIENYRKFLPRRSIDNSSTASQVMVPAAFHATSSEGVVSSRPPAACDELPLPVAVSARTSAACSNLEFTPAPAPLTTETLKQKLGASPMVPSPVPLWDAHQGPIDPATESYDALQKEGYSLHHVETELKKLSAALHGMLLPAVGKDAPVPPSNAVVQTNETTSMDRLLPPLSGFPSNNVSNNTNNNNNASDSAAWMADAGNTRISETHSDPLGMNTYYPPVGGRGGGGGGRVTPMATATALPVFPPSTGVNNDHGESSMSDAEVATGISTSTTTTTNTTVDVHGRDQVAELLMAVNGLTAYVESLRQRHENLVKNTVEALGAAAAPAHQMDEAEKEQL